MIFLNSNKVALLTKIGIIKNVGNAKTPLIISGIDKMLHKLPSIITYNSTIKLNEIFLLITNILYILNLSLTLNILKVSFQLSAKFVINPIFSSL